VRNLKRFGRAENVVEETDHRHVGIIDNTKQSLQQRDPRTWSKVGKYTESGDLTSLSFSEPWFPSPLGKTA
jgi:hypothetical protein